ncbi:MAG: TonB-dependent receptor, partial [Spirochaetia bacterium]|nr:TonB-dependent receptor [Spirochaetia bacterium]
MKKIYRHKNIFFQTLFAFTLLFSSFLAAEETATTNLSTTNVSETNQDAYASSERPAAKSGTRRLQTVNVNAGRSDRDLDIAGTVNVVRGIDMQRDAGSWIGETLNKIPGVMMAQLRGPTDAPMIRLPTVYVNYYLYLQDNVPLQSSIGYNHGAFSYSASQTSFGGIEILKGPGTALHGSDAVASVINVKSREPQDAFTIGARLAGGNTLFREARLEIGGGLGKGHSVLGSFSYQGDEGWRSNTAWNRWQGVLRHKYSANGWDINTIAIGTYINSKMVGAIPESVYLSNATSDGLAVDVNRAEAVNPTLYLRFSSEIKKKFNEILTLSLTPYVRNIQGDYIAIWEPASTPKTTDMQTTGGLMSRGYLDFQTDTRLILGADGDYTAYNNLTTQTRASVTTYGFVSPKGDHYNYEVGFLSAAPYAQIEQTLWKSLILNAGLRFDALQYDYQNKAGSNVFGSYYRPSSRKDSFTSLNPKAGITWKITKDHSLFGRYAHSFRIPSAADLYHLDTSSANYTLKPEQADSGEVGYKGSFGKILDLDLSGYWTYIKDGIADGVVTPTGTIKSNGGESQFRGVEVGVHFTPVKDLEFTLSYSYTAHQTVKKLAGATSLADGKIPVSAPANLGYAQITWRPFFLPGFFLQPEMHWIGSWYVDEANTVKKPDDFVFHARVGYTIPKTFVVVNVKVLNIFNRLYAAT